MGEIYNTYINIDVFTTINHISSLFHKGNLIVYQVCFVAFNNVENGRSKVIV